MAIVYETSELEQEKFPPPGAYAEAARLWEAGLTDIAENYPDAFVGAEVYGSLALASNFDELMIRSDMDALGQWNDASPIGHAVRDMFVRLQHQIQLRTYVRVDGYWYSSSTIARGNDQTSRNPFLAAHLAKVFLRNRDAQHLLKGEPVQGLRQINDVQPAAARLLRLLCVADGYAAHKRHRFEAARSSTELTALQIQRALEAPWALGRMLVELAHFAETGSMRSDIITRTAVRQAVIELGVNATWSLSFEQLDNLDRAYSDVANQVSRRQLPLNEHEKWLRSNGPRAVRLALALSDASCEAVSRWMTDTEAE